MTIRRARQALPRTQPILRALRKTDEAREALRQAEANLRGCFEADPPEQSWELFNYDGNEVTGTASELYQLQMAWDQFRQEGGVTAIDFARPSTPFTTVDLPDPCVPLTLMIMGLVILGRVCPEARHGWALFPAGSRTRGNCLISRSGGIGRLLAICLKKNATPARAH
jgi:hypothetical protein